MSSSDKSSRGVAYELAPHRGGTAPQPNQPTISSDEPYNVPMTLTRRQWGALLGASPLLTRAAAQAPPTPPQQKPEKPEAGVRDVSQRLAEIEVPMDIEPAFRFTA